MHRTKIWGHSFITKNPAGQFSTVNTVRQRREHRRPNTSARASQSRPALCNPADCSPPGSSVHGGSPGKDTGVGSRFLLQGIFRTQGRNLCLLSLLHWQTLCFFFLTTEPPGKPRSCQALPSCLQTPPACLQPRPGQGHPETWHWSVSLTRLHTRRRPPTRTPNRFSATKRERAQEARVSGGDPGGGPSGWARGSG